VLPQELNHRISDEFFSAMSLVSLAAARSSSDEVKVALIEVTELLRHYAEVHQAPQSPRDDARIDAATYLGKLCLSIRRVIDARFCRFGKFLLVKEEASPNRFLGPRHWR
jgi:two-component sensor histidine kinase